MPLKLRATILLYERFRAFSPLRDLTYVQQNTGMGPNDASNRFGEIIQASLNVITAHCHRLYVSPGLGAFVKTTDQEIESTIGPIYAVVSGIATTTLDPTRRIIARGENALTEDDLRREHPQLEQLMRTDVTMSVIGHLDSGRPCQYLPPFPPRIHTFVYKCEPEEIRRFTNQLNFINLLAQFPDPATDDVIAACLREAALSHDEPKTFLEGAGKSVASLFGDNTQRIREILRRLPI